MRNRWPILAVAVIVAAIVVWRLAAKKPLTYVTEPVTRGDVTRALVASGTVNPVVTVQVGSYVSGVITAIYVDYNTRVKAGQLCAQIDPRPYQVALDQAKANLASAQAQLAKDQAGEEYARTTYERDSGLLKQGGIVSQEAVDNDKSAYDQATAQVKVDQASVAQHKSALDGAQVNLNYTRIVSPVDGVVISRNVDVGQTVAASFQTPTLFLIGQNLAEMQVDTYVSESDIGGVRVGQAATFTVEGFPGTTFQGQVSQVREAPITVQNVVTYDAVIRTDNSEGKLLPGMTANVRIITEERHDVLKVPLPALQFRPAGAAGREKAVARGTGRPGGGRSGSGGRLEGGGARYGQAGQSGQGGQPGQSGQAGQAGAAGRMPSQAPGQASPGQTPGQASPGQTPGQAPSAQTPGQAPTEGTRQEIWILRNGRPVPIPVQVGINDGTSVEVSAEGLHEGDPVIVGVISGKGGTAGGRRPASPLRF